MRALLPTMLVVTLAQTAPVRAAPAKKPKITIEEVAVMLASNDEEELRSALEAAPLLPPGEVVPMLEDRVRSGLSRTLLDVAIDSLQLLNDKSASALLVELSRHRRPEVRVRALESLSHAKTSQARDALVRGLGDADADVRNAAAMALAELADHGTFTTLLHALERGIEGAAPALGKLAKPEDLNALFDALEHHGLDRCRPFFATLLARRDFPDAEKVRALERLIARGGEDTVDALSTLQSELPADASPRVKKLLADAIQKAQNP
ncbi:MAG TPA: HEAT repeat domain-containing protein [Polyangiales bacterium]